MLLRPVLMLLLALLPLGGGAHPGASDRVHQLTDLIASDPDSQYLYIQRALAWSNDSNPEHALEDIGRAEQLGDPVNAAFAHGILLYRAGRFADARRYFDVYLAVEPDHAPSLEYRARLLRDAGEPELSLADFEQLFQIRSDSNPGHYLSAARMMVQLPDRGYDDALRLLDELMASRGTLSQVQRYAIELEVANKHYGGAIQRLRTLDPKLQASPAWQLELAELLWLDGQQAEARSALAQAEKQLQTRRALGDTNERLLRVRGMLHTDIP